MTCYHLFPFIRLSFTHISASALPILPPQLFPLTSPGVSGLALRAGRRVGHPWRLPSCHDIAQAEFRETELVEFPLHQAVHFLLQ